ncbi:MAG: hypothetical protein JRN20_16455 [Nitrososphaerota archaeon]|nr:hypothetical protein [Nitrososphaerota archaeon]
MTNTRTGKGRSKDLSARRRRMQGKSRIPWVYVVPAIIVVSIVFGLVYMESITGTSTVTTATGKGIFPLTCSGDQTLLMHIHPWLRIVIDNQNVTIPANIGDTSSCEEPVHTHDSSGIIHIESSQNSNFTLGEFFQIWAATYAYTMIKSTKAPIVFNSSDILGFKTDQSHSVMLLVDGQRSNAYGGLVLNSLDYCNASNSISSSSPCYATAPGNPYYSGPSGYHFGTGHTVLIEYV